MIGRTRRTALLAAALLVPALPSSRLALRTDAGWRTWWRADAAPATWAQAAPEIARAVRWRPGADGVAWGTLDLAGDGSAWRVHVLVARVDPRRARLRLDGDALAVGPRAATRSWNVERADTTRAPLLAFNAGQFTDAGPWGWVVDAGREVAPPGHAPLAPAVVADSAGRIRLVPPDSIDAVRAAGGIAAAIQSYPMLLDAGGRVPDALRAEGRGVDVAHRDARLALGIDRDGRVLLVLTRFRAPGGRLVPLPVGLTVPELAALMGALGCERAVALDGGVSGQLLVRERTGRTLRWPGWRDVPLGVRFEPVR
ncbi:phosphodiester glycosidase family protein [Roseisolibacter agri]|uniref:Phosphodiester glycosidase domain-containing protein n=1 Tax=Roseisolibacter agri TaxID=2014610 RepID=A0AA37QEJ1_9BACT|nr:phosphodiester glycosidase family protein [Roseisolibacter agri]GLC28366.1 hypothetical protein rosag_48790 [Roseisolibacter agri]